MSCHLRLPNKYVTPLLNSGFNGRREINAKVCNDKLQARGHAYYGTADSTAAVFSEAVRPKRFTICDIEQHYLYKLFDLMLEQDVRIVLEQGPTNKAAADAFSDEYKRTRAECFAQMQEDYPDIEIVSEPLCFPDDCFGDNSHVNERGAKKYSEYTRERYSELLSQPFPAKD